MPDREKVLKGQECCNIRQCDKCPYKDEIDETYSGFCEHVMQQETISLLKEQEEQKRKWLQAIADNQLANAPKDYHEFMALDEHLKNEYKRGIYDGLQMAFEILTEGR